MKPTMIATLFTACSFVVGCATNGIPQFDTSNVNPTVTENTEKVFILLPALFMDGSTARLNGEWVITVKHNKPILMAQGIDAFYHPTCDVAVYRDKGANTVPLGAIYRGGDVMHVGYPIGLPLAVNHGQYMVDFEQDGCKYSTTTAVSMSGMSGGGVYNNSNELVGVNVGIGDIVYNGEEITGLATFVSLYSVQEWLKTITGIELPKL